MSWNWHYIFLLLLPALIDYFVAIQISKTDQPKLKKSYLFFSLFTNLLLLFIFKYSNFFIDNIQVIFNKLSLNYLCPHLDVILPVGISFYTFQTLSYTIDVYRGIKKAETHLGIFLLYVTFFPQLVAGPIERSTRLLRQFYIRQKLKYSNITQGLDSMLWGFLKKVVIADHLAVYVNHVYNQVNIFSGGTIIIATLFFAFQIYCDFSGYSDIAIGTARLFGIDLMKNFNSPYLARSVREFWKRWHISLSTWFKDYVYIPLGGNRGTHFSWYRNILIVFIISGVWHGANWTFILWGLFHGLALVFEAITLNLRHSFYIISGLSRYSPLLNIIKRMVCFSFILFTWIFFRANNLEDLKLILFKISDSFNSFRIETHVDKFNFVFALVSIIFLLFIEALHNKYNLVERFRAFSSIVRSLIYAITVVLILLFVQLDSQEFIYFQF